MKKKNTAKKNATVVLPLPRPDRRELDRLLENRGTDLRKLPRELVAGDFVLATPPPFNAIAVARQGDPEPLLDWLTQNGLTGRRLIAGVPRSAKPTVAVGAAIRNKQPFGVSFHGEEVELEFAKFHSDSNGRLYLLGRSREPFSKQEIPELKRNVRVPLDKVDRVWATEGTWGEMDWVEAEFAVRELQYHPEPGDEPTGVRAETDEGYLIVVRRRIHYAVPFLLSLKQNYYHILKPESLALKAARMKGKG